MLNHRVIFTLSLMLFLNFWLTQANSEEFEKINRLLTADLYKELKNIGENFVVGPNTIATFWALMLSAAKGDTAKEIRENLHFGNSTKSIEDILTVQLPSILSNNKSYLIQSIKALFVGKISPLTSQFKNNVINYGFEMKQVDFEETSEAIRTINEWIRKTFDQVVVNMKERADVHSDSSFFFVDGFRFQASWSEDLYSSEGIFYNDKNESFNVPVITGVNIRNYYEDKNLSARFLEIPFKGDNISLVVVLPDKKDGLAELEKSAKQIFTVNPSFHQEFVYLNLPEFMFVSQFYLKRVFENLGIKTAFKQYAADFTDADPEGGLYVSDYLHMNFAEINLHGVEIKTEPQVFPEGRSLLTQSFIVDHPFIFYIKAKDIILFAGRVLDPR